jgi:hypothetical protein
MPLLPDDLRDRLPRLYSQEADLNPIIYARFYLPGTQWAWYVIEGEPEDEDFLFFGFVMGLYNEFGYFRLSELEALLSRLKRVWSATQTSQKAGSPMSYLRRIHDGRFPRTKSSLSVLFLSSLVGYESLVQWSKFVFPDCKGRKESNEKE